MSHAGPSRSAADTQLQALDRMVAIAEFAPDGLLLAANDRYLEIFGCPREAIGQLHHADLCPPAERDSASYQSFWASLRDGPAPISGPHERLRCDGSTCWIEAAYAPIQGTQGQAPRILKIARDVSQHHQLDLERQQSLRLLGLVADARDTAIIINDDQTRALYVNTGFTQMFGWTSEEVLGRQILIELFLDNARGRVDKIREMLFRGETAKVEDLVRTRDGRRYWAKLVSNPIFDQQGNLVHTVNLLTDITVAKMHETLQRQVLEAMAREEPLTRILEIVCEEVERIDPEVTASILEVDEWGMLHPLAAPSLPDEYSAQFDGVRIGPRVGSCGTAAWRDETVCVDDIATDPLWTDYRQMVLPVGLTGCWSTPIRSSEGRVIGTFAFYFRDARNTSSVAFHERLIAACTHLCSLALEREYARARIRQLAFYDSLTGMPNRSLLEAKAEQAIASASHNGGQLAVLFVDLDRFKQINDSLGHPAGDAVLRMVGESLQLEMRQQDIAGRLSGDEFVVVLPQCDAERARLIVEHLQERLAQPFHIADTRLAVTASVGIAMFPDDGVDMQTLLQRADMAMYEAKSSGRGHFRFFSSEMNDLAQERLVLETALRDTVLRGQLQLHFQPQVTLDGGKLHGVEALARWHHPELGRIPPSRFIPLAEECGLIAEIGTWALDAACAQLADWRARGMEVPGISVNLSPTSFHDLDLPQRMMAILDGYGLQPHDLTVELTEEILLDNNPGTLDMIDRVHACGIRLSMDDFGTGYSSLSYLRRLPVSELKLDRSFLVDIEHDKTTRALSQAILQIGRELQLTVLAEGVETPTQEALLREQGYPVAQGYLFARPMPPAEFEAWLAAHGQAQGAA